MLLNKKDWNFIGQNDMKNKPYINKINSLYVELYEEDKKYGEKKLEKPQSDITKKRRIKNLKKAWMEHTEDYDEIDDFFEH